MKLNYKALGALTMLVALGAASTASVMAYDYKDYREDRREAYRDLRKAERLLIFHMFPPWLYRYASTAQAV